MPYTRLEEKHVKLLVNQLAPYASKWSDIGLQLGFIQAELDSMVSTSARPKGHLKTMLGEWVMWSPESTHGKYATLKDLKKALVSDAVGLGIVAERLKLPLNDDTRLEEKHVKLLVNQLAPYASKWSDIGLQLGFIQAELDSMVSTSARPKGHLKTMLGEWVMWSPESTHGKYATLKDLKKALVSDAVGLGIVAERLKLPLNDGKSGERKVSSSSEPSAKCPCTEEHVNIPQGSPGPPTAASLQSQGTGLKGRGKVIPSKQWGLEAVHRDCKGDGVVIAILDGGADKLNSKLERVKVRTKNYCDITVAEGDIVPDTHTLQWPDPDPHGTGVAAVAGDVAPGATLLICRVQHEGNWNTIGIKKALQDLIATQERIDIVSMSFKAPPDEEIRGLLEQLKKKGVICIAAAGNDGKFQKRPHFPANAVISVGSLTPGGNESDAKCPGEISVLAPGEDIEVTIREIAMHQGQYVSTEVTTIEDGSSYATPMVAGFLALVLQRLEQANVASNVIDMYHKTDFVKDYFLNDPNVFGGSKCLTRVGEFLTTIFPRLIDNYFSSALIKEYDSGFTPGHAAH